MRTLTSRQAQTRTEAEEFFRESCPLRIVGLSIIGLLLGDCAVVIAAISTLG